jgi:CAAX prenyl protease-like protein
MNTISPLRNRRRNSPGKNATLAYIAPFLTFVCLMAIEGALHLPPQVTYPVRLSVVLLVIYLASRSLVSFRASHLLASVAIGAAVFLIWVGPDVLFGYRHHWLFENAVTGGSVSPVPEELKRNVLFVLLRFAGCTVVVPILEELFWRGWLMRRLVDKEFQTVALGTYSPFAFWIVAVLFASEHGPYWEVGLIAGIIYNWWMIRTRSLADCIVAHAVTNGLLSVYVLASGQWQYWP